MLEEKVESLPAKPGVYLFKDDRGHLIYIGKAKRLRDRVRSYFQGRPLDRKTEVLKDQIQDLDYIVTDTELEALFLESTLVKKNQPRFNVNLKDDKAFLHIKLTLQEPYPRVLLTRRVLRDGARYFGPFLPASLARNMIKIIHRHFQLRTCDIPIDGGLERPCLEYQMKRCLGPCVAGLSSPEEYQGSVRDVILFLEGKSQELVESLTARMQEAAEREHFEAAALYRDRIRMVADLAEKQKAIQEGREDTDVFAYYREGSRLALQLFTLRQGRIVGKREFFWEDLNFLGPAQFCSGALRQYYLSAGFVPGEILVPVEIEDRQLLEQWLTSKRAGPRRVRIRAPQRGAKHDLLLLVERNAKIAFQGRFKLARSQKRKVLAELQRELDLARLPGRIEGFDISNIQGRESVASMVVCLEGSMQRAEYRKFRLRTVSGPDDFLSMFEVVRRRYRRRLQEKAPLPDLILIDGGPGQLHYAYQALAELGIEEIPLVGLAKREEHLFLMGRADPIVLEDRSAALRLLEEIRDEAHRFALSYHRKRRALADFASELDSIPGIGEKRKRRLLRNFGSVSGVRRATLEELSAFLGAGLARRVKEHLR